MARPLSKDAILPQTPERYQNFQKHHKRPHLKLPHLAARFHFFIFTGYNFPQARVTTRAQNRKRNPQPMDTPLVSVIIPNWNGEKHLEGCLSALARQTFKNFEVLLIDNGSNDGSVDFVKQNHPDVRIIEFPANRGFSVAVNQGIRESRGRIIALLNNDTEAEPGWLENGVDCLERNPHSGLAACRVIYLDRPDLIDSAGDDYAPWGAVFNRGHLQQNGPAFETEQEIFGVCASAALIRREVFDRIGLFDETFFAYYEDLDINLRARLAGYGCTYCPGAVVRHGYSGSTHGRGLKLGREEVYLHLTAVWLKNMPAGLMLRHLPAALCFHSVIIFCFALARIRNSALMPRVPFFRVMGSALKERRRVQASRKISSAELAGWFMKLSLMDFVRSELAQRRKEREAGQSTIS